jgi:hypothetical protein
MLLRVCIVSEVAGAVSPIFMVRALYRLLKGVDEAQASLMVTFVLLAISITFLNMLNEIAALTLLQGADFLSAFDKPQRDGLAMLFLGLHGADLANFFGGLWLFPFGVLVMRSGFIPRLLGVLLIIDCVALVAVSLTAVLLPADQDIVNRVALLPELGEVWIMGWLLVKGVRVTAQAAKVLER